MSEPRRGRFPVKVRATDAPDGRVLVLLQLPDGYVLITTADARNVAGTLVEVADEIEKGTATGG